MEVYGLEPERALDILDSALIVGNVNAFQADYYRAKIYANSLEGPQWDRAIALCENLLKQDSTRVGDPATVANRSKVLGVMMDACRKTRDNERRLQCAIELASLSRSQGQETEALRMEAEIGAVLTTLGRVEEGMIKLEQVINKLDQGNPSIDRLDAGIVARKRRIIALDRAGRHREIIPDAEAIIQKLADYQSNPSIYAEDSFRLSAKPEARVKYCSFYKAQAQIYMAIAFTNFTPPELAATKALVQEAEQSDYGRSFLGRWTLSTAWKALGQWDKVRAIDDEMERHLGTDTLCTDYAIVLQDRADAARARGQYQQAISYLDRCSKLKDELNEKRHQTEAQEYAARYHAMEQDLKLQEQKARSARKDYIIAIISVITLIVAIFAFLAFRQRRSIVEKNRALVRIIDELNAARETSRPEAFKPDREQFDLIDGTIRSEKLYTNAKLQRQDIVERFGISRHALNDLFTAFADGQSFPGYINNLRMQDAIRLMQEEPELPISDIAEAVGFTPATFREQFKRQFGMTPTEYRQSS